MTQWTASRGRLGVTYTENYFIHFNSSPDIMLDFLSLSSKEGILKSFVQRKRRFLFPAVNRNHKSSSSFSSTNCGMSPSVRKRLSVSRVRPELGHDFRRFVLQNAHFKGMMDKKSLPRLLLQHELTFASVSPPQNGEKIRSRN